MLNDIELSGLKYMEEIGNLPGPHHSCRITQFVELPSLSNYKNFTLNKCFTLLLFYTSYMCNKITSSVITKAVVKTGRIHKLNKYLSFYVNTEMFAVRVILSYSPQVLTFTELNLPRL